MKAFARAPSKAILAGEHFVVHGAWALAAAIGKTVQVEVADAEEFRVRSDRFAGRGTLPMAPIEAVVETMSREFAFRPTVTIRITSDVPDGAGLGSSAATMVALASALSRLRSLRLGVEEIAGFAMAGEREIHGKPSGIDAAVCARGGVILFRPGNPPRAVKLKGTRRLILVFSGRKRSTRRLISAVARARDRSPSLFAGLSSSVSELSLTAAERLANDDRRGLGRLMTLNHSALSSIGASNLELDRLVGVMLSLGCYGAKLTGAGGGGSVVAVAPEAKEKSILSELKARGLEAFEAVIPTGGVESWLER